MRKGISGVLAVLGSLFLVGLYETSMWPFNETAQLAEADRARESLNPERKPARATLGTHGEVVYSRKGDDRVVYLIGQKHYNPRLPVPDDLDEIQRDIYRIIGHLVYAKDLKFVVGEGLYRELEINPADKGWTKDDCDAHRHAMFDDETARRFFEANPKEAGYTAFELLNPDDVYTWGVDDMKLMQEEDVLRQEKAHLLRLLDSPFLPQRALFEVQLAGIEGQIALTWDMRSDMTVDDSLEKMDNLFREGVIQKREMAVVIGSYHVPRMRESYVQKGVTLFVVRPKSYEGMEH